MKFKRVSVDHLKVGSVLRSAIVAPHDSRVVLVGRDTVITQSIIRRLIQRGVDKVLLSQRDLALMQAYVPQGRRKQVPPPHRYVTSSSRNRTTERIDRHVRETEDCYSLKIDSDGFSCKTTSPSLPATAMHAWAVTVEDHIECLNRFFVASDAERPRLMEAVRNIARSICETDDRDRDALVLHACTPYESDYPYRHGIHVAELAVAMGAHLKLSRLQRIELATGCLVHDLGMTRIGLQLFDSRKRLSDNLLRRLADHPIDTIAMMDRAGQIESDACRVAYQIHERNDGSGYPRGVRKGQIDPLAKIAAVSDSLIGMLTRRRHRLAILGHYAIAAIVKQASAGHFDPVVIRSLLHVTSLYPLGGFVELSDGCLGKIIRSNGEAFARPVLQLWHPDYLDNEPRIVDLQSDESLRIVDAIPDPSLLRPNRNRAA